MYKLNGKILDENQIGEEIVSCIDILANHTIELSEMIKEGVEYWKSKIDKNKETSLGTSLAAVFMEMTREALESEINKSLKKERQKQEKIIKNKDISALVEDVQKSLDLMPVAKSELEKLIQGDERKTPEHMIMTLDLQFKTLTGAVEIFLMQKQFCYNHFDLESEAEEGKQ